jgi:hypothetical protein
MRRRRRRSKSTRRIKWSRRGWRVRRTRLTQARMMNRKTYWTNQLRRRRIDILLEDHLKVQAAEEEIFGKDQNIIGAMN